MKFTIRQEQLIQPLQMTGSIVERRHATPILSNILFRVTPQQLSITGTDLEVEMITHINLDNAQPGETTLPARKMIDICRALPAETDIEIDVTGGRATIRSGKSRFTLSTLPSSEFPELNELADNLLEFSLPQKELKQLIDNTSFSMAQQDVRYFLNGICMEIGDGCLRTVATDGHRLAMCSLPFEQTITEEYQVIIPRKAIVELSRLLVEPESPVAIQIGKNYLKFTFSSLVFSVKLIDGQFPDYQRVIPINNQNKLIADRVELIQALKRASILSNEKYRSIRLNFTENTLRVFAHNQEQEEAEEEVQVQYQGDDLEIGFNVTYLLDALQAVSDQQVKILFGDPNSSCLITCSDQAECSYVVMPMRL